MTELLYMKDMQALTCEAQIVSADESTIILDQTVFYPQGGGQPYDEGFIKTDSAVFKVEEVRFMDGEVHHIGHIESGQIQTGETVTCKVDPERRELNTRNHSAGHLLDMAISALGYGWTPGKGYHFPDGPYVEYDGELEDLESTRTAVENKCREFIAENAKTTIKFMDIDELDKISDMKVPDFIPRDKPARAVFYGEYGVPCGGTHVSELSEIGQFRIRKMKAKKGMVRIAYEVSK
jgi:Ser-tRNA(Ala) deacylase AlaX